MKYTKAFLGHHLETVDIMIQFQVENVLLKIKI